jgi:hypothetical protein
MGLFSTIFRRKPDLGICIGEVCLYVREETVWLKNCERQLCRSQLELERFILNKEPLLLLMASGILELELRDEVTCKQIRNNLVRYYLSQLNAPSFQKISDFVVCEDEIDYAVNAYSRQKVSLDSVGSLKLPGSQIVEMLFQCRFAKFMCDLFDGIDATSGKPWKTPMLPIAKTFIGQVRGGDITAISPDDVLKLAVGLSGPHVLLSDAISKLVKKAKLEKWHR